MLATHCYNNPYRYSQPIQKWQSCKRCWLCIDAEDGKLNELLFSALATFCAWSELLLCSDVNVPVGSKKVLNCWCGPVRMEQRMWSNRAPRQDKDKADLTVQRHNGTQFVPQEILDTQDEMRSDAEYFQSYLYVRGKQWNQHTDQTNGVAAGMLRLTSSVSKVSSWTELIFAIVTGLLLLYFWPTGLFCASLCCCTLRPSIPDQETLVSCLRDAKITLYDI